MYLNNKTVLLAGVLSALFSTTGHAGVQEPDGHTHQRLKAAAKPHVRQSLPPSLEQQRYDLAPSTKPRTDLMPQKAMSREAQRAATPACKNMDTLTNYNGSALADYIVNLPDYECTYPLFSLTSAQAAKAYSASNMSAIASRFTQEAGAYNATNRALVNLALYLRAGYYLAGSDVIPVPSANYTASLRAPIKALAENTILFKQNPLAGTTAGETLRLITNMHDEAYFLPSMKKIVRRYTNAATTPNASDALKNDDAGGGFTSALTVIFYAHFRPEALSLLNSDISYATYLHDFITLDKGALMGTNYAYLLNDASNEAFRFMQYPALKSQVGTMVKSTLGSTSMTGADSALWLAAASAVKYYDNANCASYGTCNYETKLADTVLKNSYTCSPTLRIRAQDMTVAQMQDSCAILAKEETYFHDMLQTKRIPVANDNNTSLELVVFDDYTNYNKYAGVIYDMDTNNGGMYLEGDPSVVGNQARFIAHEASWLRPAFSVWNLEHEYVHYLDGRFDMLGDFSMGVSKPTVWWIEGIAEYLSLRNDNQKSIDAAKAGTYKLSQIFGNTYSMGDYTNRAYRWGYMAARFMMEKHRADVDAILPKFRVGDYAGYQTYMDFIGTRYDTEFAAWVQTATTAGQPPMPQVNLPACASQTQLGKNCSIANYSSTYSAYSYIILPAGAKNLRIYTTGGSGDMDLYLALNRYPSPTDFDVSSTTAGNAESVSVATPAANQWYYVTMKAKTPFTGVTLNATYD